jgi:hypothetical protein
MKNINCNLSDFYKYRSHITIKFHKKINSFLWENILDNTKIKIHEYIGNFELNIKESIKNNIL